VSLLTESSIDARSGEPPRHPDPDAAPPERLQPTGSPKARLLEPALAAAEARLDRALQDANVVNKRLREARDAARSGNCKALNGAIDSATSGTKDLIGVVDALRSEWSLDVTEYLSGGHFAAEVTAVASSAGIRVLSEGDRLISYPTVVRVRPELSSVEIDGHRHAGLRPSGIVAALQRARTRAGYFQASPFLEALEAAYLTSTMGGPPVGQVVRLVTLWDLFTLRPGSERDYSKAEFGRDLNLLDESGLTVTRACRTMAFAASSGPRIDGGITAVGRDGEMHIYWGVAFS
jgi:hypothetical protein